MNAAAREDTIFALSSGALPAAIAIVRISGPRADKVLHGLAGLIPAPRRVVLRELRNAAGEMLDRALVLWFPGPGTATGEDMAELHLHGGRAVVAAVLHGLGAMADCRAAEAGEFTRRAFLNGRLDLAEAEGLADLLAAETEVARRRALRQAEGGLSGCVERWRVRLLQLSARAEALLEFGEDADDVLPDAALPADIAGIRDDLVANLALPPAERLRDGFRVVVAGPPNEGKSSLVNAIAGRLVAIEADEPGTTRDLIEVPLDLEGLPVVLIDSAGLRETGNAVERIGVGLAERAIEAADLVLWLGQPDLCPRRDAVLKVHARCDLPGREIAADGIDITISAREGHGMVELRRQMVSHLQGALPAEEVTLLNERHRASTRACVSDLDAAIIAPLPEVVAEHLRHAIREIDRIVGRSGVEDMLDELFGRFCIGK